MTTIADDLLSELEELENANEQLESHVQNQSTEKKKQSPMPSTADKLDAASVALEAAKASQEAAEESHKAAETAIRHVQEQKTQILELSDANLSWRQTLRAANQEISSAKGATTILVIVSVSLSLIAAGIMGWFYYSLSKKFEVFKGDMLDLVKTENKIFNRQMGIKVDQLSSLIENLSMDIQTLARGSESDIESRFSEPRQSYQRSKAYQTMTDEVIQPIPLEEMPVNSRQAPTNSPYENSQLVQQKPSSPPSGSLNMEGTENKLIGIQRLIEQILNAQQQFEASTLVAIQQSQGNNGATRPTSGMGLTKTQEQKLNAISKMVRSQEKLLKKIQGTLKAQKSASQKSSSAKAELPLKNIEKSLLELTNQVQDLKTQQNEIQQQVHDLQIETQKLSTERPYSYRAR